MSESDIAIIVGGGPGISASCARLFSQQGMKVVVAARDIEKPVLKKLEAESGVLLHACDASDPASVSSLFSFVDESLGVPTLVVHNIDGRPRDVFRKSVTELDTNAFLTTMRNSTFSAFLVGQAAAQRMLTRDSTDRHLQQEHRGTILFTNASAAMKGFALSSAFAAASQGKKGLAQSMARELMPEGIHVAHIPIDGAIAPEREDGTRAHWLAGESVDDNMLDPDHIAETYLQLHRQHKSTWTFEVILQPWKEKW